MALVNKTRTYNTNDSLTATYYNQDRDEIIAGVNSIDNAQVASGAAINESKIAFNAGGHDHTGGTKGKPIVVQTNRAYIWHINQLLTVATDLGPNPCVTQNMSTVKIWGYLKAPATGSPCVVEVRTTGGVLVATLTIPAAVQTANAVVSVAITAGTYLRLDVTGIGSSFAGQALTVSLECQQT
jgi:hypothetical protein